MNDPYIPDQQEVCPECRGKNKECINCDGTGFILKWFENDDSSEPFGSDFDPKQFEEGINE